MRRHYFHELISLDKALQILLEEFEKHYVVPIESEEIDVRKALGRVTAEPVFARLSSPYFHSAAMDGFAVNSKSTFTATEKTPLRLKINKDAFWIETGDPLPSGFDAVIPVEEVNQLGEYIEIDKAVFPYSNVRHIGEDIVATELILPENQIIEPAHIGAMLASGVLKIKVRRKPIVGILPTGSELISLEEALEKGLKPPFLIEYNSAVISGILKRWGCEVRKYSIIKDDEKELKEWIIKGLSECDILLINAGSGYGKEDFTYKVLSQLGKIIINGVAIKPGKPFLSAFVDNKLVLGIPGYPVSTFFSMYIFVKRLIEKLLGVTIEEEEKITGILSRKLSSKMGVDEFIRVKVGKVGNKFIVSPVGRGAGLLMSVIRADGYIKIPANSEGYEQGKEIEVYLWKKRKEIENTIVCIGSHDNTLDLLYNFLKKRFPQFSLSSAHVGSMGGIIAIKKREAHIAGLHLIDEETGEYNIPFVKRFLQGEKLVLINLVYREQGFIVKKGNPKNIKEVKDLLKEDVVFINRQQGAGTRILFDNLLKKAGIHPSQIKGYNNEEYTHMGVAQAVASGRADVGLGIYAAAKALDLDFIPITKERYDLLILKEFLEFEGIKALLFIIKEDEEFRKKVVALGGYDVKDMGKVIFEC